MEVIWKCETCAYHNTGSRLKLGLVPMSGIFERVGVDCIGPLPRSGSGMRHIILATDYASGYVEGVAVKNKTAGIVSDFLLKNVLMRHGPPRIFRMDSGKEFLNSTVKDLGKKFGSKMKFSTPYHPEASGKAERSNKSILAKLTKLITVWGNDWDKFLPVTLYCFNISPQRTLEWSPYEFVFRRRPLGGEAIPEVVDFQKLLEKKFDLKGKEIEKSNKKRKDPNDFNEGMLVLVKNRTKESKLDPKFVGPMVVSEVVGFGSYLVKSMENGKEYRISRNDLVHFDDKIDFECVLGSSFDVAEFKKGGMSQPVGRMTIAAPRRS